VIRGGAPLGGSLLQSAVAAVVLMVAQLLGADPMGVLFTWLSTIASVGVLALLIATAVASLMWFTRGSAPRVSVWTHYLAPGLGAALGVVVISMMVDNLSGLLGLPAGSRLPLLVPALVAAAALVGLVWGWMLRVSRPLVWHGVGAGVAQASTVKDDRLRTVRV
jgi:hypothetical protein